MTQPDVGEETGWQRRALAAEAALLEARAEQARLWDEVVRLRRERQDVAFYEAQLAHMRGSASWRLTEPLRAVKTLVIKVRRRLDA